jgi:hypothetical protein
MGKKAKLKQIRRIANQMPKMKVVQVIGEKLSGEELYNSGVEKVDDKPVDLNGVYKKKTPVHVPLNHNRKMKKLYNKYGNVGVGMYIQAVKNHVAKIEAAKAQA